MTEAVKGSTLRRGLSIVGPGLVVASGLGYVLFVAVGRILAPAEFATFAALWGLLFGAGSVLGPVEQETGRLVASRLAAGQRTPAVSKRLLAVSLGLAFVLVVVGSAAFPITVHRVLAGSWRLYAVATVAAAGFAVQFVVRGVYVGSGRVGRYAAIVVVEAGLRLAALLVVVTFGGRSALWCAVAVATGSFAWILVPPNSWVRSAERPRAVLAEPVPGWSTLVQDMGGLMLAAAFSGVMITGFPALAAALAPADERARLGVLLAALTVTRIPLLLLGPVQALLIPELVRRTQQHGWPYAVRLLLRTAYGLFAVGAVGSLLALTAGSWAIRHLYGDKYVIGGTALALMTAGATLTAMVLVFAAALVSRERHRWVIVTWVVCLAIVLCVLEAPVGSFFDRCVAALVIGPAAALVVAAAAIAFPGKPAVIQVHRSGEGPDR